MSKRTTSIYILEALVTLVEEAHVTRAADRLGISQPAMSALLRKLRDQFGDPLLVKTDVGMLPTPRARDLADQARHAIDEVERVFSDSDAFEPATAQVHFNLVASEAVAFFLMPKLMAHLRARAPAVTLSVRQPDILRLRGELEEGRVDMVIGFLKNLPQSLRCVPLRSRRLRVIAARHHPEIDGHITLEQYLRYPHVCYRPIATGGSTVESQVEEALARRLLKRTVAFYSPSVLAFPSIVAESDLLATLANDVAEKLASLFPIQVLDPPVDLGAADMVMYWHERAQNNAAHKWLRQEIVQLVRTAEQRSEFPKTPKRRG